MKKLSWRLISYGFEGGLDWEKLSGYIFVTVVLFKENRCNWQESCSGVESCFATFFYKLSLIWMKDIYHCLLHTVFL